MQLDLFAGKMNLLMEDNQVFKYELERSDSDVEALKKFIKISRMHSAGLIVYSVCTFLIILEILLLLFIYGLDTDKQNPYRVWQLIIAFLQAILEFIAVVLR